ncbi:MAG: hypothetical protein EBY28_27970, partial [Betaproteobacteria bacterium]|nr:hypothetical protein [Betaproteobacteria bacterium]
MLSRLVTKKLAIFTWRILRVGAWLCAWLRTAATAIATLTARGFLARIYCPATHGCSHGGLVGQCYVLLGGINRWARLVASLTAFTAWTLLATAFAWLTRLAWRARWARLKRLLALTTLFSALFAARLSASLIWTTFTALVASTLCPAFAATFRTVTALASGAAATAAITATAFTAAI